MKTRITITILPCLLLLASISFAQPQPQHKLVEFQMAILKKGPNWTTTAEPERNQILQKHFANVMSMYESGRMVLAGPFVDDADLAGIFIMRATSAADAWAWVDADPAVRAGLLAYASHPWWSQDIFKKPNEPLKLDTVYFGFLKRGPNRTSGDEETPKVQELQKAHIANIERLSKLGKLVVAGPFGDDGNLRGIFVFRVASRKEAEDLAATDPMIKIDRLLLELHDWKVPAGIIP